jgi:hypothetical protein
LGLINFTNRSMDNMKKLTGCCFILLFSACLPKPFEKSFSLFGNVYQVDSVAGERGVSEPYFISLTKDSLFSAFGYWDYSFPYHAEPRIDDSLQVISDNKKFLIEPASSGFWINFPDGRGLTENMIRFISILELLILGNHCSSVAGSLRKLNLKIIKS